MIKTICIASILLFAHAAVMCIPLKSQPLQSMLDARILPTTGLLSFLLKTGKPRPLFARNLPCCTASMTSDWENPVITDKSDGSQITYLRVRHAFEFDLIPGHD